MNFDQIYTAFYAQFRADSDVPASTDAEYIVGMRLANEAINYWYNYDKTDWNELWTVNSVAQPTQAVVAGQVVYDLPTDFGKVGGYIMLKDPLGQGVDRIPRLDPQEVQFRDSTSTFAYIAGGKLILNMNNINDRAGWLIDYPYYKKPTYFTSGTDVTEMKNPYYIVHRMLANQFRAARNPYYSSALRDAEDAIRKMQLENNAGSWDNPPTVTDNTGTIWGV